MDTIREKCKLKVVLKRPNTKYSGNAPLDEWGEEVVGTKKALITYQISNEEKKHCKSPALVVWY